MTGLNEVVWYVTWYLTILVRSLFVVLAASIVCIFVCSKTSFIMQLIIFFVYDCYYDCCSLNSIAFCCTSYGMAITSLFDKSETGSAVVLLVFIFGGLPSMFITVFIHSLSRYFHLMCRRLIPGCMSCYLLSYLLALWLNYLLLSCMLILSTKTVLPSPTCSILLQQP